ncbi:hypothetical protein [Polaromonas sp. YR568]|uniref:hypothetical protein n=1 Tax=Polaromonas sp. YR568 TaxID=1855301 RepID=UPI00398BDF45
MMKKVLPVLLAALLCGPAMAAQEVVFKPGWDQGDNNDLNYPGGARPYTKKQVETFLKGRKDSGVTDTDTGINVLRACNHIEIQKGCHLDRDGRHVTIYAKGSHPKNQLLACEKVNQGHAVHVYGC